jgi:hypothetical protein
MNHIDSDKQLLSQPYDQSNNGQCKTQKNIKHIDSDKQLLSHSVISLIIVITIEKTSSEQNIKQKQMTMASPDAICGVFQTSNLRVRTQMEFHSCHCCSLHVSTEVQNEPRINTRFTPHKAQSPEGQAPNIDVDHQ